MHSRPVSHSKMKKSRLSMHSSSDRLSRAGPSGCTTGWQQDECDAQQAELAKSSQKGSIVNRLDMKLMFSRGSDSAIQSICSKAIRATADAALICLGVTQCLQCNLILRLLERSFPIQMLSALHTFSNSAHSPPYTCRVGILGACLMYRNSC